ncbi:MAG: hypothetical protein IJ920_00470, partial [Paludibacteraceae bacterium]|nr:hypothetical protein [Paludibacteraceae bacterium]
EHTIGESVVSPIKASDYIRPIEEGQAQELPFEEDNSKKYQANSKKYQVKRTKLDEKKRKEITETLNNKNTK